MKIKVNKHKLNIHYRGSPWGSRTQQHAYCLRYAHSHHIESHLGKKQPQAKIAIAFLFGQLHFNNVTSHALFYGGHLVMRSKRCAVQNQGITLNRLIVEDGSNCCCIVGRALYDSINLSLSLSSPTRPLSPSHHSCHGGRVGKGPRNECASSFPLPAFAQYTKYASQDYNFTIN